MNEKQLDRKIEKGVNTVEKDLNKVEKDISSLAGDSAARVSGFVSNVGTAAVKAKDDVTTWVEHAVSDAGEGIGNFTEKAKETVGEAAVEVKDKVGHGLSQYNMKAQELANQVPGQFGQKAANYPWVSMTIALALGLILGFILKPGKRNFDFYTE